MGQAEAEASAASYAERGMAAMSHRYLEGGAELYVKK